MDPSPAPVGLVSPNHFGATSLLFGSACTPSGLRTHLWTSFELDGCAGNVAQSPLGNGATSRNGLRLALQARYSSQPLNAGSLAPMSASISAQYAAQVAAGKIERDNAQQAIVNRLVRLEPIKGLYIFGDVGRGKTMLMDMFFAASRVVRKRRVHFHEFMGEVHERGHALRQKAKLGEISREDPIGLVAAAIAQETRLLCFDEFHVTDIADAMILGRLFKQLIALDVVVVATSNVPPSELYKDGLNRALFLPFIALIEQHLEIRPLNARTDFRLEKLAGVPVWYVPADRSAQAALDKAWRRLTAGHPGEPQDLVVKGHPIRVPCRSEERRVGK